MQYVSSYLQRTGANFTYRSEDTFKINNIDRVTAVDKNKNHIQIVFDDKMNSFELPKDQTIGHWICIFYDSKKFQLYIFDSLNQNEKKTLDCKVLRFCQTLYPFNGLKYANCIGFQQSNLVDCGPYSILYCISIAMGLTPEEIVLLNFKTSLNSIRKTISKICNTTELEAFKTLKATLKYKTFIGKKINLFSKTSIVVPVVIPTVELTVESTAIQPILFIKSKNVLTVDRIYVDSKALSVEVDSAFKIYQIPVNTLSDNDLNVLKNQFKKEMIFFNDDSSTDYSSVLERNHYLTEIEMNLINILISKHFDTSVQNINFYKAPNLLDSRQNESLGQVLFKEVLFNGVNRYIGIFHNIAEKIIEVFDSKEKNSSILNHFLLNTDITNYIKKLFPDTSSIRYIRSVQQTNDSNGAYLTIVV